MSSIWDSPKIRKEMQKRGKSSWQARVEKYGEEGARNMMKKARAKVEENRKQPQTPQE